MSKKIVLATSNPGKAKEIAQMIGSLPLEFFLQSQLGVTSVPETGGTFIENAIIKARNATRQTGLPALADDSGLEVDALSGMPGIHSARYAGTQADDNDNIRKLLHSLKSSENRYARFYCVMVFMKHERDPTPIVCEAAWAGKILTEVQGQGGFGYDPIFLPDGHEQSAAELDTKNTLSHRGQALRNMLIHLKQWQS